MSRRPIRVLLVEDSPVVRDFMIHVFASDPAFKLIGVASDGTEALPAVQRLRPDIVTMDVHMPNMDGLEATRRIMREAPLPIVIVSGTIEDQVAATFDALEAGALAFVSRPAGFGDVRYERQVSDLTRTVRLMSEVKVVRRRGAESAQFFVAGTLASRLQVVAIGSSTGGPLAIQALLLGIPQDFPIPIVIVQHITKGFLQGFVEWLNRSVALSVQIAVDGEVALPGHVYVAPDGFHMGIERSGRIRLVDKPPENGLRPSVGHLLRSVREAYQGAAAAVLLSGMGRDGASELLELRRCGAHTFVQDKASAAVYGMPGVALQLGAARHVMSPGEIARELAALARAQAQPAGEAI